LLYPYSQEGSGISSVYTGLQLSAVVVHSTCLHSVCVSLLPILHTSPPADASRLGNTSPPHVLRPACPPAEGTLAPLQVKAISLNVKAKIALRAAPPRCARARAAPPASLRARLLSLGGKEAQGEERRRACFP